ncbi:MAG: hypothetical protein F6K39_32965 [Okeania sp. SIO3B3]|nr:hypothetical protein [Okeania sp. SIO3B3]
MTDNSFSFLISNLDFRFIYWTIVIALPPKRSLCLCRLMFYLSIVQ